MTENIIKTQREIWDEEHKSPKVLLQMDVQKPSIGVRLFQEWLKANNIQASTVLDIGCGKGRNAIWLAQHGFHVTGYDFSDQAISIAKKRASACEKLNINFKTHDLTTPFPNNKSQFDIAVDCFASTDIDSYDGRLFCLQEIKNSLKLKGLLLVYTLSTQDEYHSKMIKSSPANEKNAFYHPQTGKFEKVFSKDELLAFYHEFTVIEYKRINKTSQFEGKSYNCNHHWLILEKSA